MARYTTHLDYEGFGVYEFAGAGASPSFGALIPGLPGGVSPEEVMKLITVVGGLQMIKPDFRTQAVTLLDKPKKMQTILQRRRTEISKAAEERKKRAEIQQTNNSK